MLLPGFGDRRPEVGASPPPNSFGSDWLVPSKPRSPSSGAYVVPGASRDFSREPTRSCQTISSAAARVAERKAWVTGMPNRTMYFKFLGLGAVRKRAHVRAESDLHAASSRHPEAGLVDTRPAGLAACSLQVFFRLELVDITRRHEVDAFSTAESSSSKPCSMESTPPSTQLCRPSPP